MSDALEPIIEALQDDFTSTLTKYRKMSLHSYLTEERKWSHQKIAYIELMLITHNQFHVSGVIDIIFVFYFAHRNTATWKTLEGGMSRLPEACARTIELKGGVILCNALVQSIEQESIVKIGFVQPGTSGPLSYETFDAIIVTIPPPRIYMLLERP